MASPTNSTGCSTGYYMLDETINLSGANPTPNWYIENWSGTDNNSSTSNTNIVTMPASDHTAEVNYNIDCQKLTLEHTGMGSDPIASPTMSTGCNSGYYVPGASINLSGATPDPDWKIISWSGTNNNDSTAGTNIVTMPANAHSAGVNYGLPTCYTLTLGQTGNGATPTASPPNSTNCSPGQYHSAESITLSGANPDNHWQIDSWYGTSNNSSISSSNSLTMPANNHSAGVNYSGVCYLLTLGHTGDGSTPIASPSNSTGCSSGFFHYQESISLSGASPSFGYHIEGWYGTNNNSSTLSSNSFTMPGSAHLAGVNYVEKVFPFTCVSNTGNNATYGFVGTVGGFTPAAGDVLAAFTSDGAICTGNEPWDDSNLAVTVWGDNDQTPEKDGMNSGETILWQVWDKSTNNLCTAVPSFSMGSGDYVPDGINIINRLEVTCPSTQFTDTQVGNTAVTFRSLWLNLVELFGD